MYVWKTACWRHALWVVPFGAILLSGCGSGLLPGEGDSPRSTLNLATLGLDGESTYYETDFNDLFTSAEPVRVSAQPRVIRGWIDQSGDVDVYDLGPVALGDRILISMTTADSLDGVITLFDDAGAALLVNDHRNVYLGKSEPYIDLVMRRPAEACYVAATATPGYGAYGEYGLVASREHYVQVPEPRPDVILLVFNGSLDVRIGRRPAINVPAFDAGDISSSYAGLSATMAAEIVAGVREDFEGYNLTILSTLEGDTFDGEMTRVFFGTFDEALLGVAEGIDEFNAAGAQRAVVFTDTFGAFMPLEPSAFEMAQAIANVTSHEIGHLLGLVHTSDPGGIMDVTASMGELLLDQRFSLSPIHDAVFPMGYQDGVQSLLDSVGGDAELLLARRGPADSSRRRVRTDPHELPVRAAFYLSSCGLEGHDP